MLHGINYDTGSIPSGPAVNLDYLANVRPSARQYDWQKTEFYAFIHFGMNTMTNREWGDGSEKPEWFDPAAVDAEQWVSVYADAGMRGLILTCKHHDGFALWPSAHTSHSVASSPWREGRGDLVREVADACGRRGMKFGVYLSPWDRAEPTYGSGKSYDDFYVAQLTELLTGYGDIFAVWLDGANGEGPNGKRQVYDWDRYYRVIRSLQPNAVISVCGPDVRWCGNEAGHTRTDEWSVVPWQLRDAERTAEHSQRVDDGRFSRTVTSADDDLGSRTALSGYPGEAVWYPAEVNTSIRPGWFHHPAEDEQVRSADELFDIYRRSVGGNATLLLNVPPQRDGTIGTADRRVLAELGDSIRSWYASDVAGRARRSVSSGEDDAPLDLRNDTGYWRPDAADPAPTLRLTWDSPRLISAVVLKEQITLGQRIERVELSARTAGGAVELGAANSVGYQRFIEFEPVEATELVIRFRQSRGALNLAGVGAIARGVRA